MADTHTTPTIGGTAVGFYQGKHANLKNLKGNYKPGSFYITNDTDEANRLYLAKDKDTLTYLNKSIVEVANQTALFALQNPMSGEFYYVKDGNILCYYSTDGADADDKKVGNNGQWIQVNVNDNDNTWWKTTDLDISDGELNTAKDAIDFTVTLTQINESNEPDATVVDTFTISKEDINELVDHIIKVCATPDTSKNEYTVALNGSDAADHTSYKVKVTGSLSLDSSSTTDEIVIKGVDTKYDFGNTGTTLQLTGDGATDSVAILANKKSTETTAANQDIVLDSVNNKEIVIKHKDYSDGEITNANVTTKSSTSAKDTFTILKGVNVTNGHVTGVTTATITLPEDKDTDIHVTGVGAAAWKDESNLAPGVNPTNGTIWITQNDGSTIRSTQDLFYKINDEVFYNQASLDSGLKKYVEDNLAKVTNAMTFKGGIAGDATGKEITTISGIDATKLSIGDTYVVTGGFIKAGSEELASTGDIIIASGTEDEDGYITSASLTWTVVPGTEIDTTYLIKASGNQIHLVDEKKFNEENKVVSSTNCKSHIELTDDDVAILETTTDGKIKASHVKIGTNKDGTKNDNNTPTKTLEHSAGSTKKTFQAVTGITYNGYGHVSGVETTTFTMPENPDQTNDHKLVHKGSNVTELQNTDGDPKGSFKIDGAASGPISVSSADRTNGGTDYTITHASVTKNDSSNGTKTVNNGGTFQAVTAVTYDDYGHVSGVETKTMTVDVDIPEYALSGATLTQVTANKKVTITDSLAKDGAPAGTSAFNIESKNANLVLNANSTTVEMSLVWGTF